MVAPVEPVAALRNLDLREPHSSRLVLGAPWGVTLPATGQPGLYIVREGPAWIRGERGDAIALAEGDVVLLPKGATHAVCSDRAAEAPAIAELFERYGWRRGETIDSAGGGGRVTHLDTFCFTLRSGNARELLSSIPDLVVLPARAHHAWTSHVARALSGLIDSGDASGEPSTSLSEILFGVALRDVLTRPVTALRTADASIAMAVTLIHADLAHRWTVAKLARRVGHSRSAFHDRFARWTHRSPMDYVLDARMARARELLENGDLSVQEIAEMVGYESASSFAVAFRRRWGLTPTEARANRRRVGTRCS